jgi:hypothetical protein
VLKMKGGKDSRVAFAKSPGHYAIFNCWYLMPVFGVGLCVGTVNEEIACEQEHQ